MKAEQTLEVHRQIITVDVFQVLKAELVFFLNVGGWKW